jgi:hypothetical protein
VRRHHPIDDAIGLPTVVGRIVKMRAVVGNDLIEMFDATHSIQAC